ncbi:unnamed protein product [Medioppia subpectinata]|uniref:Uncharacterized protein n=1 Tax=Medioppia subpectinata TaxID=1979941 RepID=A0A7R9LIX3_9ACAR|nr:unnamed protein product [Medioppia subpectinata]CAG2118626.1 unnamed protein product [Medioppia subpectinata]
MPSTITCWEAGVKGTGNSIWYQSCGPLIALLCLAAITAAERTLLVDTTRVLLADETRVGHSTHSHNNTEWSDGRLR